MAGLLKVLWGAEGGGFKKPQPLKGTDGEMLVIQSKKDNVSRRVCIIFNSM